jgi:hypothetical protein
MSIELNGTAVGPVLPLQRTTPFITPPSRNTTPEPRAPRKYSYRRIQNAEIGASLFRWANNVDLDAHYFGTHRSYHGRTAEDILKLVKHSAELNDWDLDRPPFVDAPAAVAVEPAPVTQESVEELLAPEVAPAPAVAPEGLGGTLAARGARYGSFADQAVIAERLVSGMTAAPGWDRLDPDMKEALRVIANKTARILNGDPSYSDSWHDIAGYATLVDVRLKGIGL